MKMIKFKERRRSSPEDNLTRVEELENAVKSAMALLAAAEARLWTLQEKLEEERVRNERLAKQLQRLESSRQSSDAPSWNVEPGVGL
jgi:hypothetical protein